MKFMEKVWGSLGIFEPVEPEEKADVPETEIKVKKSSGNVVNLPTVPKQIQVMVVEPFSFDDAQQIADYLKSRKPVVVNLENTDGEIAKRMIDFMSGTAYALGGTIQKIGKDIFLCAPYNVEVDYTAQISGLHNDLNI